MSFKLVNALKCSPWLLVSIMLIAACSQPAQEADSETVRGCHGFEEAVQENRGCS
jgi:hypothetical protein